MNIIPVDFNSDTRLHFRTEKCLPNLRWCNGVLQQAWFIEGVDSNGGYGLTEWRDVPTETDDLSKLNTTGEVNDGT